MNTVLLHCSILQAKMGCSRGSAGGLTQNHCRKPSAAEAIIYFEVISTLAPWWQAFERDRQEKHGSSFLGGINQVAGGCRICADSWWLTVNHFSRLKSGTAQALLIGLLVAEVVQPGRGMKSVTWAEDIFVGRGVGWAKLVLCVWGSDLTLRSR